MNLKNFLFGQDDKLKKKTNYNPDQEKFMSQFMSQLMSMLNGSGGQQGQNGQNGEGGQGGQGGVSDAFNLLKQYLDPNSQAYKDFEEPYLNEFHEKTLPDIAERFAGGAAGGALSSSDFAQALGGAASGYKSNLTGLKQGMQQKNIMDMIQSYLQQSQIGLSAQPFSYVNKPGNAGLIPSAVNSFVSGAGQAYGKAKGAS